MVLFLWLAFALQTSAAAQLGGLQHPLSGSQLQLQLDAAVAATAASFVLPKNSDVRLARSRGRVVGEGRVIVLHEGGFRDHH